MSGALSLPDPHAPELTADRAYTQAFAIALTRTLGRKKGQRLLRAFAEELRASAERADVIPICADRAKHARERDARIAALRAFLTEAPAFLSATYD